ncbi:MAG: primosomal protein N' [Alphaproteobacteria bacterium]|nr:primosomal protein N' [Alphaproteobacteria bacterium]
MLFGSRIVSVLLPQPLLEAFDYFAPEGLEAPPGSFVVVSLGPRKLIGVVWGSRPGPAARPLKSVIEVIGTAPLLPEVSRTFIDRAARYVCVPPGNLLAMAMRSREALEDPPVERLLLASGRAPGRMTTARERVLAHAGAPIGPLDLARAAGVSAGVVRGLAEAGALDVVERAVDAPFAAPDAERSGRVLTKDQQHAAATASDLVRERAFRPILLDGVTGSGKTEVYFEAIAAALRDDPAAQVLVLLPEIALTQAVMQRFEGRFGAVPAEWHSAAGSKARRRAWREVATGRARIVVGARSALFLPFQNLRLIVVDEEHDASYKQNDGVSYHARDLAVLRAQIGACTVILASATPSLETLANARQGRYVHLELKARPGVALLPRIVLADMRADPPETGKWISPPLLQAMEETLAVGEQVLLYLNRRGYAPLVICKSCGERLKAPNTDSWLTEHRYSGMLVCHLTGFTMRKPAHCPHCKATGSLTGVGPGVERLAEETRNRFPAARTEIFSSDTAASAEALRDLVGRMERAEIDILIGTQIAAKGHNFPRLTLVGAIDADSGLKGGDLRAGERTFQLLSQVAGRAGRADRPGRAIIQTYAPDSPAIAMLATGDRHGFMSLEMEMRQQMGYPPFGRLGAVILSGASSEQADEWSMTFGAAAPNVAGVDVWGPAPAPIGVLRGRHRRRFLVRSDRNVDLSAFLWAWKVRVKVPPSVRVTLDVEPYNFM